MHDRKFETRRLRSDVTKSGVEERYRWEEYTHVWLPTWSANWLHYMRKKATKILLTVQASDLAYPNIPLLPPSFILRRQRWWTRSRWGVCLLTKTLQGEGKKQLSYVRAVSLKLTNIMINPDDWLDPGTTQINNWKLSKLLATIESVFNYINVSTIQYF